MQELERLRAIWVIVPSVLSILGLCSLVENVLTWHAFMKDIMDVYVLVRVQIMYFIFDWWLSYFDTNVPEWLGDIMVVWFCLLLIIRISTGINIAWISSIGVHGTIAIFVLAPFLVWQWMCKSFSKTFDGYERSDLENYVGKYSSLNTEVRLRYREYNRWSGKGYSRRPSWVEELSYDEIEEFRKIYAAHDMDTARLIRGSTVGIAGGFVLLLFINWQVLGKFVS